MKRAIALFLGLVVGILLVAAGQAAEIVGTIVSTSPSENLIVVRAPDGSEATYRVVKTTTIRQGTAPAQLGTLAPGSNVKVVVGQAAPAPPTDSDDVTVVYPVVSGIVVQPEPAPVAAPPARAEEGRSGVRIDTPADRDTEIEADVHVDHDDDD